MGVNHTVSTPTSAQQRMLAAALAFVLTVIGLGQAALPAHAEQEGEVIANFTKSGLANIGVPLYAGRLSEHLGC